MSKRTERKSDSTRNTDSVNKLKHVLRVGASMTMMNLNPVTPVGAANVDHNRKDLRELVGTGVVLAGIMEWTQPEGESIFFWLHSKRNVNLDDFGFDYDVTNLFFVTIAEPQSDANKHPGLAAYKDGLLYKSAWQVLTPSPNPYSFKDKPNSRPPYHTIVTLSEKMRKEMEIAMAPTDVPEAMQVDNNEPVPHDVVVAEVTVTQGVSEVPNKLKAVIFEHAGNAQDAMEEYDILSNLNMPRL